MTTVTIQEDRFFLDGVPTYAGRTWRGLPIEGLLLNSRMVQATFDDENPQTRSRWAYPDGQAWDADRNVREFLAMLPVYRSHGVLALTVNFQGGSPEGYSQAQPWENNAFLPDGTIKPAYLDRMARVLDHMDELGMVAILGVFYFGQDERLQDEAAVVAALENVVQWVLERGYRHVLLEVNNECDVPRYEHEILTPPRVSELISRAQNLHRNGKRLYVGTSFRGNAIPTSNVVAVSDFLLLHGNGVRDPNRIAAMVDETRAVEGYRPMPILFNEDDHFDFDQPQNNFIAALSRYASWGFFDPGENNYRDGYQSVPVNWSLSTPRKQAFFALTREIAGVG
jgi:hypothetical protein